MRALCGFAAAALLLLLLAVPSFNPAAAGRVQEAVEEANRVFVAAYTAQDSRKIAALYAPDAAAFPPGAERANGRDAIRKVWQGTMDAGVVNVTLRTVEVEASGNLAYESGEYTLEAPGKDDKLAHVVGKYVVIWKQDNGAWYLYRDIWN